MILLTYILPMTCTYVLQQKEFAAKVYNVPTENNCSEKMQGPLQTRIRSKRCFFHLITLLILCNNCENLHKATLMKLEYSMTLFSTLTYSNMTQIPKL